MIHRRAKRSAVCLCAICAMFIWTVSNAQENAQPRSRVDPLSSVGFANRTLVKKPIEPGEGECEPSDPAHAEKLKLIGAEFNLGPGTLKGLPIPEPNNLGEFVKDKQIAIALGKALFWDMQVGSDGVQACASCHFRAGADPRSVNQLAPGGTARDNFFDEHFEGKSRFSVSNAKMAKKERERTFDVKPINSRLEETDFPFYKLEDPTDRGSRVIWDYDDVVSSQGVFKTKFVPAAPGSRHDLGAAPDQPDEVFNINGTHTRRVEPRNTPTVINAIFNHRNFWDGRAQEIFNGRNVAGVRDEKATIIKAYNPQTLVPEKVRIDNASLASLSVGPPLSTDEMSYENRTFPEIGRRLLRAQPLVKQVVDPTDSVLSGYAMTRLSGDPQSKGLSDRYEDYVKKAFHDVWWNSDLFVDVDALGDEMFVDSGAHPAEGHKVYRLIEYNFSLYYGLALQLYMATLVSDDAKIDRHFDQKKLGNTDILTAEELRGMDVFTSEKARCADCHHGPEFTGANVRALKIGFLTPDHPKIKPPFSYWQYPEEVERMFIGSCDVAIYNQGFYNIGVRPFTEDLGIGGLDAFQNPLSAAEVLTKRSQIKNQELRDLFVPRLSVFMAPSLATEPDKIFAVPEIQEGERTAVKGAFKMPTLRNVELTAPYFHTGGYLTLRQVVEFYNRGGDFHDWISPEGESQDRFMDLGIGKLNLTEAEIDELVAFLKTLTDQRVVNRSAPFDHPQLFITNGHDVQQKDGQTIVNDVIVEISAVGAAGGTPIQGFLDF